MVGSKRKEIRISGQFNIDIQDIYSYGEETFGAISARNFISDIFSRIWTLDKLYLLHPECRHLPTKTKKYRNIILGTYLVIYRITNEQVEVLRIIHSHSSINNIKRIRRIRL
jgi:toxin ParE1/3/4